MAVSCTRPLVALLLLMVVAGPLQAQADSEIRAASESQLPRKVLPLQVSSACRCSYVQYGH